MSSSLDERVSAVRSFNRFYTNVIGVLRADLLRTPYSLTEARVLVELGTRGRTEVVELRRGLDIDAGYLSRILARFEADRLVVRERSGTDARRQVIKLTEQGAATYAMLDARSAQEIEGLLSGLTERDRDRLVTAMASIRQVLEGGPAAADVVLRPLAPGDCGWVIHRHGVLYAEEYGWDETFEALVARIVAGHMERRAGTAAAPPRPESAWIAEAGGERVGCVFCTAKDDSVAQLRLLLVEPDSRASGIGGRLVAECVRFARDAGYARMTLWTNDVLTGARRLYERAGFELVSQRPHHSFGHDLVGQDWTLELTAGPPAG